MTLKNLTCTCCGGTIDRRTMKCSYCGTEYAIENDYPVIRVERFTNPVKTYRASLLVNREGVERLGADYMRYCLDRLAHEMLPALMDGMLIRSEFEPEYNQFRIDGTLRYVVPERVPDRGW